jgi:hypothetical protein
VNVHLLDFLSQQENFHIKNDPHPYRGGSHHQAQATTAMAAAAAVLMAAVVAGSSGNLVVNPSFEEAGSPVGGAPKGWGPCPPAEYVRVTDVVHAPSTTALRQSNQDASRYRTCTQHLEGIQPGRRYNVSAWVRSANISGADTGATLCMEYLDAHGKYIGGVYPAGVKGATGWTKIWAVAEVPLAATSAGVSVYTRKGMVGTGECAAACSPSSSVPTGHRLQVKLQLNHHS